MASLDVAFDLAHEGTYGTAEEAERALREFLDCYGS